MKIKRNIFVAFMLNLAFSVLEIAGGIFTGSVAIMSDAVHDLGDAVGIGVAFLLEKKSCKQPDDKYTYGYLRYSVMGSVIITFVLLFSSAAVIYNAVIRLFNPSEINYDGMILLAVIGVAVNLTASFVTRKGDSLNRKAVNLHMLEDVLGWVTVLSGAIVMKVTDFYFIDPLMSIGVSVFILINAVKNMKAALDLFLEKTPCEIDISELKKHLCEIEGVSDVHHIHLRSVDGYRSYATMHIVACGDLPLIKSEIRKELKEHGIVHTTLEIEAPDEKCNERECKISFENKAEHHHHHH